MIKDTFVLVGGSHDGERAEVNIDCEVIRKATVSNPIFEQGDGELSVVGGEVVYEHYTRRVFFSDPSHWHIVYALDSMLHHEVADALFIWYRPIESDASFRSRLKKAYGVAFTETGADLDRVGQRLFNEKRRGT